MKSQLTFSRLHEVLCYAPDTGVFTWTGATRGTKLGQLAGTRRRDGYLQICLDSELHLAHRLAWFYMTGEWPADTVDHRDGDPTNDRWVNLRCASMQQQSCNTRIRSHNKSGFKGVSFLSDGRAKPWFARIKVSGKQRHLGYFSTPEEAHAAYAAAALLVHGEFARIR